MLESPDFMVPERARRFLSYIVEESLAGRADRIKAFSIATDVLGRGSSFDGSSDPVVRIEAGRVRRALEHYYLTAGADDPIIITIPKGGYVPTFTCVTPGQVAVRRKAASPVLSQSSRAGGVVSAGRSCWRSYSSARG